MSSVVLDADAMRRTLGRMAHEILEANQGAADLVVIGVIRRGWPLAKRLAFAMTQVEDSTIPCGRLDISNFRDDRKHTSTSESEIPFQVDGKNVILVDEVIYTGRTTRAALEALLALGRPARVELAVLIDRGHRELPIQPNYCGRVVTTEKDEHVVVKFNEIDGEDGVILLDATEREALAR